MFFCIFINKKCYSYVYKDYKKEKIYIYLSQKYTNLNKVIRLKLDKFHMDFAL